jgi:hypothetical protein
VGEESRRESRRVKESMKKKRRGEGSRREGEGTGEQEIE